MTAAPAKSRATSADVLAAPANMVAELIEGALATQPRPSPRHAMAMVALGRELSGPQLGGPAGDGGWIVRSEPDLHLGENVVVPDLAAWRRERLPALPEEPFSTVPPDWACEVLSVSAERRDRGPKRPIHAEAGVGHLWLVDPRAKVVDAFGLVNGHRLLPATVSGDDAVSLAPFEAVSFPLSALWPLDPPAPQSRES